MKPSKQEAVSAAPRAGIETARLDEDRAEERTGTQRSVEQLSSGNVREAIERWIRRAAALKSRPQRAAQGNRTRLRAKPKEPGGSPNTNRAAAIKSGYQPEMQKRAGGTSTKHRQRCSFRRKEITGADRRGPRNKKLRVGTLCATREQQDAGIEAGGLPAIRTLQTRKKNW